MLLAASVSSCSTLRIPRALTSREGLVLTFCPSPLVSMHIMLTSSNINLHGFHNLGSMGGSGKVFLDAIERWLEDDHKDKKRMPLGATWAKVPSVEGTPQQVS